MGRYNNDVFKISCLFLNSNVAAINLSKYFSLLIPKWHAYKISS